MGIQLDPTLSRSTNPYSGRTQHAETPQHRRPFSARCLNPAVRPHDAKQPRRVHTTRVAALFWNTWHGLADHTHCSAPGPGIFQTCQLTEQRGEPSPRRRPPHLSPPQYLSDTLQIPSASTPQASPIKNDSHRNPRSPLQPAATLGYNPPHALPRNPDPQTPYLTDAHPAARTRNSALPKIPPTTIPSRLSLCLAVFACVPASKA